MLHDTSFENTSCNLQDEQHVEKKLRDFRRTVNNYIARGGGGGGLRTESEKHPLNNVFFLALRVKCF